MKIVSMAMLCLALTMAPAIAQSLPQRFTAFAVSTGGPRSNPVATRVDITINRWSTAAEADRLMRVLEQQGAEALLESLRELKPVGRIQTPGNLGYDLHFAQQQPGEDGGRRIFLATDRPISHWEAVNRPRTIDYPFTFIELRVNDRGEGEGKLALATKIDVSRDGKVIELVNYMAQPIDLNAVKLESR
jgi:hypothetical protein